MWATLCQIISITCLCVVEVSSFVAGMGARGHGSRGAGALFMRCVMRRLFRYFAIGLFCLTLVSCSEPFGKTAKGAIAGTAVGAGTGALVGSQVGSAGVGAAIGAGVGAVGGAIIGSSLEAQDEEEERLEELRRRQEHHLARQKREIEDMRRQQRYDELYRKY